MFSRVMSSAGGPWAGEPAVLEEDEPSGIRDGQVDVVLGGQDRLPLLPLEAPEDLVDLDLVADVEMGAGLVEEQKGSVLGQRPGDEDALALAAAQPGHLLVREMGRPGQPENLVEDGGVLGRGAGEAPLADISPHEDDLGYPELENGVVDLGDIGDAPRHLAPAQSGHGLAVDADFPRDVGDEPLERLDERAFAGAVPPQDGDELPLFDAERDVADDGTVPVSGGQVLDFEHGHLDAPGP